MAGPAFDPIRLAGTLCGVCLIAATLLAGVNSQTKPIIDKIAAKKAVAARKAVLPASTASVDETSFQVDLSKDFEANAGDLAGILSDSQEKAQALEVFQGRDKDGAVTGYAFKCALPDGYSGVIEFMAGVSWDDEKGEFVVAGSKILKHGETPGLGANIEALSYEEKVKAAEEEREPVPDYLRQYEGKGLDELRLKKEDPPGPLDALTAATITSKAYTQAMRRVVAMCNRNVERFRNPPAPAPAGDAGAEERG